MTPLGLCTSVFHCHLFTGLSRVRSFTSSLVTELAEWPARHRAVKWLRPQSTNTIDNQAFQAQCGFGRSWVSAKEWCRMKQGLGQFTPSGSWFSRVFQTPMVKHCHVCGVKCTASPWDSMWSPGLVSPGRAASLATQYEGKLCGPAHHLEVATYTA